MYTSKAVGASVRIFELLDRVPEVHNGSRTLDEFKGCKFGEHSIVYYIVLHGHVIVLQQYDLRKSTSFIHLDQRNKFLR